MALGAQSVCEKSSRLLNVKTATSERWGWALCLLRRGMRLGNDGVTAGVPYLSLAPEDERVGLDSDLITVQCAFERLIVVGFWSRREVNDVGLIKRERA